LLGNFIQMIFYRIERVIFVLFAVILSAELSAQSVDVSERISQILNHPLMQGVDISIYAYNISDSKIIFQKDKDRQLNPASVTKLFTSSTALYYLGAYYKFPTEFYVKEFPDDEGVLDGDLYIKGFGDPRMVNENIFNLILELKREGINRIDGSVYLDTTFFDKEYFKPGWQKDVGIRAYYAPISAFAVDFNSFTVYVKPASSEGEKPVIFIEPPLKKYFKIKNSATTTKKGNTIDVDIKPGKDFLEVLIKGEIGINQKGKKFNRRVEEPDSYALEVLKWFFDIHGVKVKGKFKVKELPQEDVKLFYTYYSEPLMTVIRDLNKHSNNFSADQLLKHLGGIVYGPPATFEKGLTVIDDFAKVAGVDKSEYHFTNGSGLSHENRVSTEAIVKLLNYVYSNFQIMPDFLSSLSIASADGTIRKRFFGTPCELKTRAKTGSIDGVASIAGYTTNSKSDIISFAIIANNFEPKKYREVSEILDSIIVEISK